MKAARINEWGTPVQIEDIPQPTPNSDEVLVKVHAASLNGIDVAVAAGYLQGMVSEPMTIGTDFAGEVTAVGTDITHVKAGDQVYGVIPIRGGAFAEYVLAKANEVALKPQSFNDVQASAVPLTGLSAWQALFNLAKLQAGERLLIHGAGGAVGSFAVQLAKLYGATVIASDIPEKRAHVLALGADEFIDAKAQRFEDVAKDIDVVLDTVGGEMIERSYAVLKAGGRFVTMAGQPSPEDAEKHSIQVFSAWTQPTIDDLTKLAELIDAGTLKVFVNRTFPLNEAQSALTLRQDSSVIGKVVLTLN